MQTTQLQLIIAGIPGIHVRTTCFVVNERKKGRTGTP